MNVHAVFLFHPDLLTFTTRATPAVLTGWFTSRGGAIVATVAVRPLARLEGPWACVRACNYAFRSFFSKWIFTCIINGTRAKDESHHFLFVCHLPHCLPSIQFTFIIAFYIHIISGTCYFPGLAKCLNKSQPLEEDPLDPSPPPLPPTSSSPTLHAVLLLHLQQGCWSSSGGEIDGEISFMTSIFLTALCVSPLDWREGGIIHPY